jgi:hypothetical protein
MEISKPNRHGVLEVGHREIVASHGRSYAAVKVALCVDGQYRFGVQLTYSYGGFSGPISSNDEGYSTLAAARHAALEELLRCWHDPFPSEPATVHAELRAMRKQIENRLRQPSLL